MEVGISDEAEHPQHAYDVDTPSGHGHIVLNEQSNAQHVYACVPSSHSH